MIHNRDCDVIASGLRGAAIHQNIMSSSLLCNIRLKHLHHYSKSVKLCEVGCLGL